jgi:hypothetical protein
MKTSVPRVMMCLVAVVTILIVPANAAVQVNDKMCTTPHWLGGAGCGNGESKLDDSWMQNPILWRPTRRSLSDQTTHPSYFVASPFRGRVGAAAGSSSRLARPSHHLQLFSPPTEV